MTGILIAPMSTSDAAPFVGNVLKCWLTSTGFTGFGANFISTQDNMFLIMILTKVLQLLLYEKLF